MRLLRIDADGSLSFTNFLDRNVPNFAILSHTWRGDQEPTYQDVINSKTPGFAADNSPSFDKLYFCGEQAKTDRLQYFWADTCCIDKSSSAELSEAINSMFRWYRSSSKCYVLLSDVSTHLENDDDSTIRDSQLRRSRWFTRGWTLQELLAPPNVEFFSREGHLLGSKKSLEKLLSEITGIPVSALRGTHPTFFTIGDRMSWAAGRQTTREEDAVYSLLGLFDVHLPAIYGEGQAHAMRRLQSEIETHPRGAHADQNSDDQPLAGRWIVPFDRNSRFIDREVELTRLESMLFANDEFAKVAVSGLGGVGKTQLVLELLYRLREKKKQYAAIWIQATNMESLNQGYHAVARRFGIRGSGGKDENMQELVQNFLSEQSAGHWILVFDNADDIDMWIGNPVSTQQSSKRLIDYIPRSDTGRVIFTTRNRKVAVKLAHRNVVEVGKMTEEMSTQMLRNFLIHKDLVDSRPADTRAILTSLTHLPLAIAQAAAYINENAITLGEYLTLMNCQEQEVVELLTEEFEDDARYSDMKNPVATTWLISFQAIQRNDPLAADFMSFMACVDHKDIPQNLLPPGPSRQREMGSIGTLSAYSFITRRPEDAALDLHRLVHLTVRNWLRREGVLAEWTHRTAARLEYVFPDHDHGNRLTWRSYLPHACHVLESDLIANDDACRIALGWKVALCFYNDGRFREAEALFRDVLESRTAVLGAEHPDTLKSMAKLALAYHAQSRFQESKELGLRAMEGQKRVLGEEDPETLSTMGHLAMTYSDLSQWKESEALELQTLELRRRILGSEHPDTLTSMSNLVYLFNCQGWWKQAEDLGKQTVTARKKVLGVENPDTLLSIGNLAHTYNNQGQYHDAEELLAQVVKIRARVLGSDHPHTLSGMSNLAVSYHNQGRLDEAEALQAKVVAVRTTVLGPEHFSTLTSMAHLASTYQSQGRLEEAEQLGLQVVALRKKVLGPEHHHSLNSMTSLASIYLEKGQLAEAEELGLQVLAIRVRLLGMEHHHSLASMEHLAATYEKQGRLEESQDLREQVAGARKKVAAT